MKLREYLASKAAALCFAAIALIFWGVFAYLTGAAAALLWGSIGFFLIAVILRCAVGYISVKSRLEKLNRMKANLTDKYLLGELLPTPADAAEREYYEIMKEVSRSAIGAAENAAREKEEYFDSVEKWIHEIKTPLTACSLICDNGADPIKLRRELKKADNCTDTILQYARLRSPEHDTSISKTRVSSIIGEAIRHQKELLIAANIGITVSGDFWVYTDEKALCFILKQLFINCAKYCAGCRVAVTAAAGIITVADDGPGIASYDLPRICERGFTGNNGKNSGTGMGLYIVSELCKRLSIGFDAASQTDAGTRFSFTFPQYKAI